MDANVIQFRHRDAGIMRPRRDYLDLATILTDNSGQVQVSGTHALACALTTTAIEARVRVLEGVRQELARRGHAQLGADVSGAIDDLLDLDDRQCGYLPPAPSNEGEVGQ